MWRQKDIDIRAKKFIQGIVLDIGQTLMKNYQAEVGITCRPEFYIRQNIADVGENNALKIHLIFNKICIHSPTWHFSSRPRLTVYYRKTP